LSLLSGQPSLFIGRICLIGGQPLAVGGLS